jgi:hypothetical protein
VRLKNIFSELKSSDYKKAPSETFYKHMPFTYQSGEVVKKGDRVLYNGEASEIELVVDPLTRDAETAWFVDKYGGGVIILEPTVLERAFLSQPKDAQDLVFVARGEEIVIKPPVRPSPY